MISPTSMLRIVGAFAIWTATTVAWAYGVCGPLESHYGPFDYWTDKDKLPIVEQAHFTPNIELLQSGNTGSLGKELAYTLHAFPNHPRALMAMVRLGEKERTAHPRGARYSVACYLDRAVRFRPEDGMVRMIYGVYLAKQKKDKEALKQLEIAEKQVGESANLHYNLGLVYFDLRRYEEALKHAHAAYRLGFQLMGLKNKLMRAKRWRDPEPRAPAASAETNSAQEAGAAPKAETAPGGEAAPETRTGAEAKEPQRVADDPPSDAKPLPAATAPATN